MGSPGNAASRGVCCDATLSGLEPVSILDPLEVVSWHFELRTPEYERFTEYDIRFPAPAQSSPALQNKRPWQLVKLCPISRLKRPQMLSLPLQDTHPNVGLLPRPFP